MRAEIHEQPSRWATFLREAAGSLTEARHLLDSGPHFVLFVARGTSDNAALYGSYLVQTTLNLPTGSASPSATTLYGARPDMSGVLVVAISQSGQSPDLLAFAEMARSNGAKVLAITNAGDSPLAAAAHVCLDVMAGPERAVAATKTYTGQLLALLALLGPADGREGLEALPSGRRTRAVRCGRPRAVPRGALPLRHARRGRRAGLLLGLGPGGRPQAGRDRLPVGARLQRCGPAARTHGDARRDGPAAAVRLRGPGRRPDAATSSAWPGNDGWRWT